MTRSSRSDHGFQRSLVDFIDRVAFNPVAWTGIILGIVITLWFIVGIVKTQRTPPLSCLDEAVETCSSAKGATWESVGLCIKDEQAVCLEVRAR